MPLYIYASVNQDIIGSDDGLLPVWQQAIIWPNTDKLSIRPRGNKIQWHLNCNWNIFINENAFVKCCLENGIYFLSASMS